MAAIPTAIRAALVSFLAAALTGAQNPSLSFKAEFEAGGSLRAHIRSGEVHIVGSDRDGITVRFEGPNASRGDEVTVSLKRSGSTGNLTIKGGPRNDFRVVVEIPRQTSLFVRVPFGELDIDGVTGDKDVEVHSGEVNIEVEDPEQFGHAEASVYAGELSAECFQVEKGGLFRSFKTTGNGNYRLHAHVGTGQLTLKGPKSTN
jgi:hypothetical protein